MTTLVDNLAEAVKHYPRAEAVIHGQRRMCYGDLWAEVNALASFLFKKGLKQGDRVAVLMENSPEYVSTYYGVLAAGGVVVSLNTAVKVRDLSNWIKHSGSTWLIATGHHLELPQLLSVFKRDLKKIIVGQIKKSNVREDNEDLYLWQEVIESAPQKIVQTFHPKDNHVAAIIYTSGTTGHPKGVTLSHSNLYSNTQSILEYLQLTNNDRIVNVLPFYFSYGNSVLHTHLAVGGCVVLENSLLYPHKVMQSLEKERATGFSGVPSTYSLLMSRVNFKDYDLSNLRYLTQAGGPMAPVRIKKLCEDLPNIQFFVMYGQTEASARLAYLPPDKLEQKVGSIGVPIPGVEIEIRDEHQCKVQPGKIGEICASGKNIMLGYWNDETLTKKVVKDGWLHTGDLAHYDEDGYIYIDGRSSDMIKSGANRISPKEIEEVIQEFDEVQEVAVVGVPDEILGEAIKAVIVLRPGTEITAKKIQAHCRNNLAIYKIPKFVEFVETLPKTSSGKVRRFLLKE